MDFDFDAYRKLVMDEQDGFRWWAVATRPVTEYLALRELPESAPLAIRAATAMRARLAEFRFQLIPGEPLVGRPVPAKPQPDALRQEAEAYIAAHPFFNAPGQNGHAEPFYDELFREGVDGIRARVAALAADAQDPAKAATYESFDIALDALSTLIGHAAEDAAEAGRDDIAASCRRIAHAPPASFRDAIQLTFLLMFAIQYGDRALLVGPGRLDVNLGPFYEADAAAGRISRDEARSLVAGLYLLINATCDSGLAYGLMVGGETVNDLSYLALEALRLSRLPYPSVGVRVNESVPESLLRLAVDIQCEGIPNPAFFNDRVIRAGLESYGVPPSESAAYINSSCVEITPSGASNVYVASPYYNLSGCLLEAMRESPASFDALFEAFERILAGKVAAGVAEVDGWRRTRYEQARRPLQSVFTRDCIERGLDIECGGARYNWAECSFVGLANLVDSLLVVRHVVYETREYTLPALLALLESDFEGQEPVRQRFLRRFPKYGQDQAEADSLVARVIGVIDRECARHTLFPDDSPYVPGTFCWIMHQRLGAETGATPDGRAAGFPFADGAGPAQGRETRGPTAAVKSVCSWNHQRLVGGSAFNMKFARSALQTEEARDKLLSLVKTFIDGGGFQTQINVVDSDVLLAAKAHPEDYADVTVRIGGYTDYFVKLDPKMQDEVILRTHYETL
ncbi:MAG: pyruvate formate lyase family protein [Kiritimatiellia bacterium]|jgi:pyruvate-formate lyase